MLGLIDDDWVFILEWSLQIVKVQCVTQFFTLEVLDLWSILHLTNQQGFNLSEKMNLRNIFVCRVT